MLSLLTTDRVERRGLKKSPRPDLKVTEGAAAHKGVLAQRLFLVWVTNTACWVIRRTLIYSVVLREGKVLCCVWCDSQATPTCWRGQRRGWRDGHAFSWSRGQWRIRSTFAFFSFFSTCSLNSRSSNMLQGQSWSDLNSSCY